MTIVIRYPNPEDYESLCLLRWNVLRKPYNLPKGSEKHDDEDKSYFVVALDYEKEKIVGTARLTQERYHGKIDSIAVDPDYHDVGIRSSMLSFLHEKARGLRLKYLYLWSSMETQDFYKKLGYEKNGLTITKPYTDAEYHKMTMSVVVLD